MAGPAGAPIVDRAHPTDPRLSVRRVRPGPRVRRGPGKGPPADGGLVDLLVGDVVLAVGAVDVDGQQGGDGPTPPALEHLATCLAESLSALPMTDRGGAGTSSQKILVGPRGVRPVGPEPLRRITPGRCSR